VEVNRTTPHIDYFERGAEGWPRAEPGCFRGAASLSLEWCSGPGPHRFFLFHRASLVGKPFSWGTHRHG